MHARPLQRSLVTRLLLGALLVPFSLAACSSNGSGVAAPADTTVLVYVIGSDLETRSQFATLNILEMMQVGSTAGMNVVRLNMSHGDHESHARVIKAIRTLNRKVRYTVPVMLDTQGPEIRTGHLSAELDLREGQEITIVVRGAEHVEESSIQIDYADIINAVDNFWAERLARPTVIEFGAISPSLGFPMTKADIELASIPGSVSMARDIGEALLFGDPREGGLLQAVLDRTGGVEVFRGKVSSVDRHVTGGWAIGDVNIEGSDAFAGDTMRVTFQNENLMAYLGDEPVVCVPDLITIVEQDTCRAITTERLRFGSRVSVLAMPCDDKWLTPAGLALAGPRHFGYDVDYAPYAGRRPSPGRRPQHRRSSLPAAARARAHWRRHNAATAGHNCAGRTCACAAAAGTG